MGWALGPVTNAPLVTRPGVTGRVHLPGRPRSRGMIGAHGMRPGSCCDRHGLGAQATRARQNGHRVAQQRAVAATKALRGLGRAADEGLACAPVRQHGAKGRRLQLERARKRGSDSPPEPAPITPQARRGYLPNGLMSPRQPSGPEDLRATQVSAAEPRQWPMRFGSRAQLGEPSGHGAWRCPCSDQARGSAQPGSEFWALGRPLGQEAL